jgi:uncharacterized protein (DUF305 family)
MLAINLVASALVMYVAMFAMIDGLADFYNNLNMLYMVLMMVAPMGTFMLLTMSSMYAKRNLNRALHVLFVILLAGGFLSTRQQMAIADTQFLRSMIPHHSGAILMCREASMTDPEIASLCEKIIHSQKEEIDQMRRILVRGASGN